METVALVSVLGNPFDAWKHRAQGPHAAEHSWWKIAPGTTVYRGVGFALSNALLTPGFLVLLYNIRREQDGSFIAGMKARLWTTMLLQPLEYGRSVKQATDTIKISTEAGKIGLGCYWRGLSATLWRDMIFAAIYWGSFHAEDERAPFIGAVAATLFSHPFDVIKTKMQTYERQTSKEGYVHETKERFMKTTKELYKEHGLKIFSVGLLPRMIKVVPTLGVLGVGAYEMGWVMSGDGYSMLGPVKPASEAFVFPQPENYGQLEMGKGWAPE